MRKIRLFSIILLIISLSGCGNVKSSHDLRAYAKKNFGKATLISEEETADGITCCFIDKTYGFEYFVKSEKTSFGVDGSHLLDYFATTTNYPEMFYSHFESELAAFAAEHDADLLEKGIEISYIGHIENYLRRADLADFSNVSEEYLDDVKEYADSYIEYFQQLDQREVFKEVDVSIRMIGETNPTSYH